MRQRLPRRLAAKKALVKRENQGNLAPVENGGRFFCVFRLGALDGDPRNWALGGRDRRGCPRLRGPLEPFAVMVENGKDRKH